MIYVTLFSFACGLFVLGSEFTAEERGLGRGLHAALAFVTAVNALLLVLALG